MPIYEYECSACGNVIEVMQKVNARRSPGRCEKCSGRLKKKISVTSFQLKGGGWYSDGYGDDSSSSRSPDAASKKKKKKETKTSAKPKKKAGSS